MWPGAYGDFVVRANSWPAYQSLKRNGAGLVDIFYHRPDDLDESMARYAVRIVGISSYSPERTREAAQIYAIWERLV